MKRQSGYYWVKFDGEWEIAHYRCQKLDSSISYFWTLPAYIDESWWHSDSDFDEIDENRIERVDNSKEQAHWEKVAKAIADVFKKA